MTNAKTDHHIVLLGDSIFDNAKYVPDGLPVIEHLLKTIPSDWQASLVAIDGAKTCDVFSQTTNLPDSATHLIISVGGNDAISHLPLFAQRVNNIGEALLHLGKMRNDFCENYRAMLHHVMSFQLPVAVCTIHTSIPDLGSREKTALSLFNEVILQEAFSASVPVIDLRLICNEAIDYSEISPIEPSHAGGQKIAKAIYLFMQTYETNSYNLSVISTIQPKQNKKTFSTSAQLLKRRNEPTTEIAVLLPNGYDALIDVIEICSGRFRRRGFDHIFTGENCFLWGDEFEAIKINNELYQFEKMAEPANMLHIRWNLGLFAFSGTGIPSNDDWVNLSTRIKDRYCIEELKDYLISLNGALEIEDIFQCVAILAHIPTERKSEFFEFLAKSNSDLKSEKMEYLEANPKAEDCPFIKVIPIKARWTVQA